MLKDVLVGVLAGGWSWMPDNCSSRSSQCDLYVVANKWKDGVLEFYGFYVLLYGRRGVRLSVVWPFANYYCYHSMSDMEVLYAYVCMYDVGQRLYVRWYDILLACFPVSYLYLFTISCTREMKDTNFPVNEALVQFRFRFWDIYLYSVRWSYWWYSS